MKFYRHIFWDWNGTLLDDAWLCVEIMNELLGKREMPPVDIERYRRLFDFPVEDYYRRIGFDFEDETFDAVATEYMDQYNRRQFECRLQAGAGEILQRLGDSGVTQSILSACAQKTLDPIVEFHGIGRYFIEIAGLDDHYAVSKIANGRQRLESLNRGREEILLVGDTRHDCEVAVELGIDCVLIPSGHHEREKLEGEGATVVDSLGELLDALSQSAAR